MATKTLTITEEAYNRLAKLKKGKESFSEVINRVSSRHTLREIYGILSKEAGEQLEKNILENRRLHRELREKRLTRLLKEFS